MKQQLLLLFMMLLPMMAMADNAYVDLGLPSGLLWVTCNLGASGCTGGQSPCAVPMCTHEIWARERMNQGWTFGEKRDDVLKHHPCLIAYEDLPEEDKVYDRNTSVETLKLILKLGYEIKRR